MVWKDTLRIPSLQGQLLGCDRKVVLNRPIMFSGLRECDGYRGMLGLTRHEFVRLVTILGVYSERQEMYSTEACRLTSTSKFPTSTSTPSNLHITSIQPPLRKIYNYLIFRQLIAKPPLLPLLSFTATLKSSYFGNYISIFFATSKKVEEVEVITLTRSLLVNCPFIVVEVQRR